MWSQATQTEKIPDCCALLRLLVRKTLLGYTAPLAAETSIKQGWCVLMKRADRVTWTLTACTALALFGDATLYAVLPSEHADVGIAAAAVGWMLSINRLVRLPLNAMSGWLGDRVGPRGPYIVGLLLGVISTAGYAFVRGFWPLFVLRALWGVAWALIVVSAYGMILGVSTSETRGRLTGTYASFSFFGGAVGAMLGGYLVDVRGWVTTMQVLGACSLAGLLLAFTLPRTPARTQRAVGQPLRNTSTALSITRAAQKARDVIRRLDSRYYVILLVNFTHRALFAGVLYATLGRYLLDVYGDPIALGSRVIGVASLAGILSFVRNLVTVVVGPGLGHVSDRLQDRATLLSAGAIAGACGLGLFAIGESLVVVMVGVLLTAIAYGIMPPLLMAWLGDITPTTRHSSAVSAYQTMGDLGSGLAPILVYWLLEALSIRTVYLISAGCLLLAVPFITRMRALERRRASRLATPDAD